MLFLILSILCSVTVGVAFKLSRKYNISVIQVITWNYLFALLLCFFTFSPDLKAIDRTAPWSIYITLGILLPSIFIFLAASIKHMGIVKTDASQRLSLFIPLLAAWLIFNEEFNLLKITAFLIGFPALLLILSKPASNTNNKWMYPAAVLIGFGLIDILFKQIALYTSLPFSSSLFIIFAISLVLMIVAILYDVTIRKTKLTAVNILFGALVGAFNFGNILFYLKAHQAFADNPSTVFAAMNMGVIILGSLLGILVFKEKMSKRNYLGLALALVSIVLIALSQIYV